MPNGTGDGGPRQDEPALSIVNTLSLIIVLAYLAAIPLWMFQPPIVPPEVLAIINQQMGGLQMAFAAVIGYHIGSSKGAKDAQAANRETMSTLATTAATAATTAAVVAGVAPPPVPASVDPAAVPSAPAAPPAAGAGPSPGEGALAAAAEGGDQVHVEGDVAVTTPPEGVTGKPERGGTT